MPDSDNNPNDLNHQIDLSIEGGAVRAKSRDIATSFGKEHRNVLQAIDSLIAQEPSLGLLNFQQTPYVDPQNGQSYRAIEMDRDGFTLLAMGFTGPKALKWKLAYIEAFNQMEKALRDRRSAIVDMRDTSQLRIATIQLIEMNQEKDERIAVLEPQAEAMARLASSEGSIGPRLAAKMLGMPERKFTAWLQSNRWAFRQNGIGPLQAYVDKRDRGYLEHRPHTFYDQARGEDRTIAQLMITPKGLAKIALALGVGLRDAA